MSSFMTKLKEGFASAFTTPSTTVQSTVPKTSASKPKVPKKLYDEIELAKYTNDFNDKILSTMTVSQHISSPFSIYMLMTLVSLGANTNTRSFIQLFNELVLTPWRWCPVDYPVQYHDRKTIIDVVDTLQQIAHRLYHWSSIPENHLELEIINDFYIAKQFQLKLETDFMHYVSELGDITLVDFADATATIELINNKVNAKTRGMITQLIDESDISPDTQLILVNCFYFNPIWQYQFDKYQTRDNINFTSLDNSATQVSMMNQTNTFDYYEDEQFQMVTLPYKHNRRDHANFVMNVVLPKKNSTDLTQFNSQSLMAMKKKSKYASVQLSLPRFEQNTELEMVDFFKQLGVTKIFKEIVL